MKLINIEPQFIVRDESIAKDLNLDKKYIIYSGLGHVVLKYDLIKDDFELFDKIKENYEDKYFFRLSSKEDPNENKNELRSYLSNNFDYFKPKTLENGILYFLGSDLNIVTLEKISSSKNFNGVEQYRCEIKVVRIDNKTGEIEEKILWEKVKYGSIENFLPKDLSKFSPCVESLRKRLYYKNRKKSEK